MVCTDNDIWNPIDGLLPGIAVQMQRNPGHFSFRRPEIYLSLYLIL